MTTDTPDQPLRAAAKPLDALTRDERRKAALKANMARRKAQANARQAGAGRDGQGGADGTGDNDNEEAQ